ncbi:MAG: 7-cyano-7-deazaguanine/7-aminomethyl-7-deazaguanine transporter [Legionella sp.]|uniref:7-cyano-7-deazaguanine/7-aminomethyl-7- deazaguanine transporter n=1 Tax=Legionella sp. TaxID=459 RepID=UPI00284EAFB3|nr:7-cyano-7-deazaguanine/7-aminomethyl-7-deazaguanine transporter [Legionella sp.]
MNQNIVSNLSIKVLCACHIFLLTISNVLVQYPFDLLGFHTTWGAFTYPAIFILTDLTIRLSSAKYARKIIFLSMFPGLLISYGVASYIEAANKMSWQDIFIIHPMPLRIAFACFFAYLVGQLIDITIFQRVRKNTSWWFAPVVSSTAGNLIDTMLFFAIAFYHCNNAFLSQHWTEIAIVDIFFKSVISLIACIPIYGIVLNMVNVKYSKQVMASS